MISIEIMVVMAFTLIASAMYIMYRYFDDLVNSLDLQVRCEVDNYVNEVRKTDAEVIDCLKIHKNKIELLEQKIKDGLQNNSICCKSSLEPIKKELERLKYLYEKQNHGSIKVVMPEVKSERKASVSKAKE
ncbi:hypothetical protein [Methylobacter sp.]|uniref:hypothetical protein n=1 Tax=Methylobacter sp. TaxID=2051955 RepID=UPI003DA444C7